jgi:hypothetical protein
VGESVRVAEGARADPVAVRDRLDRCIVALERLVEDGRFDTEAETCGFEVEFVLCDPLGRPRQVNDRVLAALDRSDAVSELAQFTVELNLAPRPLRGEVLSELDDELFATLGSVSSQAQAWGARAVTIGTLPTLHAEDLTSDHLSADPRYPLLDVEMAAARGRRIHLDIAGRERLRTTTDSIGVQSAASSLQVHVRVGPGDFARYYNAAQAVAAAQVAAGGNSPYLLGRRLWHETRIALLTQSLDVRPARGAAAHAPPRVWLGDSWASSATDVLADNVRQFAPLIPLIDPVDPLDQLAAGDIPSLHDLRLHNGTVWRWNRPVYDVQHGHPHLRIENRVLPSGPTPADMAANAAFLLGLVRAVADLPRPVSDGLPFAVVADDLQQAARHGLDAALHWAGQGHPVEQTAAQLVLDTLLPLAATGLDAWGIDPADRDRYLTIVERRVALHRTGADWQTANVDELEARGVAREPALREMLRRYVDNASTGEPVHAWC